MRVDRNTLHRAFFRASLMLACALSCGPSVANAQVEHVRPVDWSRFGRAAPFQHGDEFGQKLARLLQLQSRYVLAEIDRDYKAYEDLPAFPGVEYYYPFERGGSTEHGVRPLGDLALGIAVMLKTGIFSPATAKVDEAEAVRRVELAIRGIAFTNRSNRAKGRNWGGRGNTRTCWQAA
jgi:hypothetical protein